LTVVPPLRTDAAEPPGPAVAGASSGAVQRAPRVARGAPRRPAGARTRPRSRLTRRGRMVVGALVLAAMLAVAALAWLAGAARADAAGSGASLSSVHHNLRSVVVRPGESLWTIAAQAEPTADPRSVIQEIIDLNALGGTSIQPGQRLWVPRG
jgi:LysM domain